MYLASIRLDFHKEWVECTERSLIMRITTVDLWRSFNPCPSLPSVATDDRKQFRCLNNKTKPLFLEFNLCEDASSLSKTDTANSKTASFSIQSAKLVNVFPFVVSLWVIIIIFKILNKALRKEKRSMYRIKRNWIFHLPSKPTQFLKQIESLSVIWYKNNLQKVNYN